MAVKVFDKPRTSGDVWIRDDLSREYSAESLAIAASGADVEIFAGSALIIDTGVIATVAEVTAEAATPGTTPLGFAVDRTFINDGETKSVAYFERGEGLVANENDLPTVDAVGASYVAGEIKTVMEASEFVVRAEPTRQEQQIL